MESKVDQGSRFSFLIPLSLPADGSETSGSNSSNRSSAVSLRVRSRAHSLHSGSEIESLVEALGSSHMSPSNSSKGSSKGSSPGRHEHRALPGTSTQRLGTFGVTDSNIPVRPVKVEEYELELSALRSRTSRPKLNRLPSTQRSITKFDDRETPIEETAHLRILIVEVRVLFSSVVHWLKCYLGQRF